MPLPHCKDSQQVDFFPSKISYKNTDGFELLKKLKVTILVQAAQGQHSYQVFTFLEVWMIIWKIVSALYYGAFLLESPVIGCGLHQYIIFFFFSSGLSLFIKYLRNIFWLLLQMKTWLKFYFHFLIWLRGWQPWQGMTRFYI